MNTLQALEQLRSTLNSNDFLQLNSILANHASMPNSDAVTSQQVAQSLAQGQAAEQSTDRTSYGISASMAKGSNAAGGNEKLPPPPPPSQALTETSPSTNNVVSSSLNLKKAMQGTVQEKEQEMVFAPIFYSNTGRKQKETSKRNGRR